MVRVVNWRLWSPLAGIMRGLRFLGKVAQISVAFLLPLAWLLVQFVLNEREDFEFVQRRAAPG